LIGINALSLLERFDAVGMLGDKKGFTPIETCTTSAKVLLQNKWKEKPRVTS